LKLVRAAHGVNAMNLLCRAGLFIDFGAIVRCVYDCTKEVYFLLEDFPKASGNVDKFVKSFFADIIDGYLSNETPSVPTIKIRSAAVRVLKGDEGTHTRMENVYKTFCGYVHANYSRETGCQFGTTRGCVHFGYSWYDRLSADVARA
jgi:hypothetical protein